MYTSGYINKVFVYTNMSHCPGSGFEKKMMPIRGTITGLSMLPSGED